MSNYFICMGFSDLIARINFDEKAGIINISINTKEVVDTHMSFSITQAKVLSEAIQNMIANVDVTKINKENTYGDIQIEMGNE